MNVLVRSNIVDFHSICDGIEFCDKTAVSNGVRRPRCSCQIRRVPQTIVPKLMYMLITTDIANFNSIGHCINGCGNWTTSNGVWRSRRSHQVRCMPRSVIPEGMNMLIRANVMYLDSVCQCVNFRRQPTACSSIWCSRRYRQILGV